MMRKIFYIVLVLAILTVILIFKPSTSKEEILPPEPAHKYYGVTIAGPEFELPQYPKPDYVGYTYFKEHGLRIIRIPFKWERLQQYPEQFNEEEVTKLIDMVAAAAKAGQHVIIEPHNFGRYQNQPLTSHDVRKFSHLWGGLADKFRDNPGVWGYELMNEPHDLPGGCEDWRLLSQEAITAIREKDQTHYILIPGYNWQSAADWKKDSHCLVDLHDPQNKLIYAAHIYFDEDKSGRYISACEDTMIGVKRAQPFLMWLSDNNKIGMFTEYGVPPYSCWMTTLDNFLNEIYVHSQIIGGIYWAAGPAWGQNYELSIEPNYEENKDRPQMNILKKYPTK